MKLSESQQLARDSLGHTLIIATAGSGKTRTLIDRAVRILSTPGKSHIAITSFTRDSAKEISDRLALSLPCDLINTFDVATIHSLSVRECRDTPMISPVIQEELSQTVFLKYKAKTELGLWKEFLSRRTTDQNLSRHKFEGIYQEYCTVLEKHGSVDLNHVILEATNRVKDKGTLFSHLLVDEFQDLSLDQINWVLAHADQGTEVTAVGDDDQSIYGWRQSLGYKAFAILTKRLAPKVITLGINFRCANNIVEAARNLIEKNDKRIKKDLTSYQGSGQIRAEIFANKGDELDSLVERISLLSSANTVVVICRTNRDLWEIEDKLKGERINYTTKQSNAWWSRPIPRIVYALCHAATTGNGVSKFVIEEFLGIPFSQAIDSSRSHAVNSFLDDAHKVIGGSVREQKESTDLSHAIRILKSMKGSIKQRLLNVTSQQKLESNLLLCTAHSSKGLEFDCVFMPFSTKESYPKQKAGTETTKEWLEEERRLFFVGLTRAKTQIHITGVDSLSRFVDEALIEYCNPY